MEFLGLFLRRHFARKAVVESRNVGCFLRLGFYVFFKKKSLERTSLRILRTILPIKVFVPWLFYLLMDKQGPILFEELQSISLLPISFLQVFGANGQPGAFVLRAVEVVEGEAEHELVKEELLARAQRAKLKSVNCRIVRVSDISKTLTSVARNAFAFLELPVEV